MGAISDSSVAKEQLIRDPKPELAENQEQLLHPMLQEYAEAVDKCTRSANEFVRCASLLSEAREAYEKLRSVSGEIKKVMASDEAKLSALMAQVQKTADTQMPGESGQSSSERKNPESSKISSISIANGDRSNDQVSVNAKRSAAFCDVSRVPARNSRLKLQILSEH